MDAADTRLGGGRLRADICTVSASAVTAAVGGRSCAVVAGLPTEALPSGGGGDGPCPRALCERALGETVYQPTDPTVIANKPACAGRAMRPFDASLTHPFSLQRATTAFCARHRLTHAACALVALQLATAAHRDLLAAALGLPPVQHLPTPRTPFVFLHVEKTAGSAIRMFAERSADRLGLGTFLPCHGGLSCGTFNVANATLPAGREASLPRVAVLGGHFSWGVWRQLPTDAAGDAAVEAPAGTCAAGDTTCTASSPRPAAAAAAEVAVPPCLVVARHPVPRAVSYYYQVPPPPLLSLSPLPLRRRNDPHFPSSLLLPQLTPCFTFHHLPSLVLPAVLRHPRLRGLPALHQRPVRRRTHLSPQNLPLRGLPQPHRRRIRHGT